MSDPRTRQEKRTPISLKIKFKSETLEQFIERYAVDVSHGGIFIRTKEPLPVGTEMRFQFQLKDSSTLITGNGTVAWIREANEKNPNMAPGMGVRFTKLGEGSQEIIEKILKSGGKSNLSFEPGRRAILANDAAPKKKLGNLAPKSAFRNDYTSDQTPLPEPVPFKATGIGAEFFEESTKVAAFKEIQALSEKTKISEEEWEKDVDTEVASAKTMNALAKASVSISEKAPEQDPEITKEPATTEIPPKTEDKTTPEEENHEDKQSPPSKKDAAKQTAVLPIEPADELKAKIKDEVKVRGAQEKGWDSTLLTFAMIAFVLIALGGLIYYYATKETAETHKNIPTKTKSSNGSKANKGLSIETLKTPDDGKRDTRPAYQIKITTIPSGASLSVADKGISSSPHIYSFPQGTTHQIIVQKKGYRSERITVNETNLKRHIKLKEKPYFLEITTSPKNAKVEIEKQRIKPGENSLVPIKIQWRKKNAIKIFVSAPKYQSKQIQVPLSDLSKYQETEDQMIFKVSAKLEKKRLKGKKDRKKLVSTKPKNTPATKNPTTTPPPKKTNPPPPPKKTDPTPPPKKTDPTPPPKKTGPPPPKKTGPSDKKTPKPKWAN